MKQTKFTLLKQRILFSRLLEKKNQHFLLLLSVVDTSTTYIHYSIIMENEISLTFERIFNYYLSLFNRSHDDLPFYVPTDSNS